MSHNKGAKMIFPVLFTYDTYLFRALALIKALFF